ncbi:MAG: CPBP family intramembrane metalloprotease [Proteobacteria bacterium]|nr:CPBP family intramembrane metalloprotease [Pseudomonadota bacterium]
MTIAAFLSQAPQRAKRAVQTLPSGRDWLECALALIIVGAVAAPLGLMTGLLHVEPHPWAVILKTAAVALFIPAIGEELAFRALLVPDRSEAPRALWAIVGSTAVFTGWHVFETLWQPEHRTLFLRPDFLAWAAWLGVWCAILRRRSGSVWPGVVLHWLTVVAWIGWLGGPGF